MKVMMDTHKNKHGIDVLAILSHVVVVKLPKIVMDFLPSCCL
jgi:hypothetical protein